MAKLREKAKNSQLHPESAGRSDGRLGSVLDPAAITASILQLRRARGQVEGIERMIQQNRYCVDIIVQITAARASLQLVAKSLLETHLKACHRAAMNNGGAEADAMYQELLEVVTKMAK